jgi:hypothetical protein
MPAVSNTSPIFNLACINRLPLLPEQFGDVWIPKAVDDELRKIPDNFTRQTVMRYWDDDHPEWDAEEHAFAAAWRKQPKGVLYSLLRAIAGSTRVARTAGIPHAAIATTTSVATARSDEMSNVPTP